MESLDQYRALARYNRWMNERLYALGATLSDDERRRDRGAFFRSIHGILNHLLLADRAWLGRFTRDPRVAESRDASGTPIALSGRHDQELYADFEQLLRERAHTDAAIEAWVGSLDAGKLSGPLAYRTSTGERCEHPLWWALTHFFNHQTHHRGQLTTLFSQAGLDPGVTDLIVMLRAEAAGTAQGR